MNNDMKEKKPKIDRDLEYINSIWHKLTWWQQKKIYFRAMWYFKTRWFRVIPIRWIEHQIRKEK